MVSFNVYTGDISTVCAGQIYLLEMLSWSGIDDSVCMQTYGCMF